MIKQVFMAAAMLACLSSAVYAAPIDASKSSVTATGKQLGVAVTGKFKKLSGDVKFNPAQLGQSSANLVIDIASYDMGLPQYNQNIWRLNGLMPQNFLKQPLPQPALKVRGINTP